MTRTPLEMAVGFGGGVYDRSDVAGWVDAEVLARDVLPDALLELSTLHGRSDAEVERLLKSLGPKAYGFSDEARAVTGMLRAGRVTPAEALNILVRRIQDYGDPLQQHIDSLHDEHELAIQGVYGDKSEVEAEVRRFLLAL